MAFIYERRQSGKLWCTPAAGVEFQRKQSNQCKKISKRDDLVYSRHALFSDGCNFSRRSTESFNWSDRPMTACHVSPFPLNSMSGDSKEFVYGYTRSFFHWFLEIRFAHLLLKENKPWGIQKTLIDNNGSWSCLCHCLLGSSLLFLFFKVPSHVVIFFGTLISALKEYSTGKKARKFNHRDSC